MKGRTPSAIRAGSSAGYKRGWSDGYRLGAAHSIAQAIPSPGLSRRELKVMFVRENSTGYHLIESGIISALDKAVSHLVVANTLDPIEQIAERERPDLMLVLNGIFVLQPEVLERIRSLGVRTAAWFADDPYFMELSSRLVPHYDVVFTHEAGVVDYYRMLGGRVYYLPFAAHLARACPQHVDATYWSDICFIGSGFANRLALFDQILPHLKRRRIFIAGSGWQRLRRYAQLRHSINLDGVQVDEAVKYYNGAKIVINLHRTHDLAAYAPHVSLMSVNPRTFEINGCASLQLADVRADLSALYVPGEEIATFADAKECLAKINYYLSHEHERLRLALGGYAKTRSAHTYEHRIAVLLATIFGA